MRPRLPRFQAYRPIRAPHLNALVDAVDQLGIAPPRDVDPGRLENQQRGGVPGGGGAPGGAGGGAGGGDLATQDETWVAVASGTTFDEERFTDPDDEDTYVDVEQPVIVAFLRPDGTVVTLDMTDILASG